MRSMILEGRRTPRGAGGHSHSGRRGGDVRRALAGTDLGPHGMGGCRERSRVGCLGRDHGVVGGARRLPAAKHRRCAPGRGPVADGSHRDGAPACDVAVAPSLLTNQRNLLRLNLWRLEGVVFLVLMVTGQMPALWALPAGVGDILVGAAAFPVASRLDSPGGVRRAIGFNLFGLADLIVAVALGIMTSPGPAQVFHSVPTSELVTHFPLALVPAFLVPLAFMLHIVSLWQLFGLRWVGQRAPRWAAPGPALPHSGSP